MIPFEQIDDRLAALGKTRAWLATISPYTSNSIRAALAPNSTKRSERLHKVLSDAIEAEEARQAKSPQIPPGFSSIFLDDDQLNRADQASRLVSAPSLADFCREAILRRADEIIQERGTRAQEQQQPRNVETLPLAADEPAKYRRRG